VFQEGLLQTLIPFQFSPDQSYLQLSCDETADYTDLLVGNEGETALQLAIAYWKRRGMSRFIFERLPFESPTILSLIKLAQVSGGIVRMQVGEIAPYISIDRFRGVDWARYRTSTTIRGYLKRKAALHNRLSVEIIDTFECFRAVWPVVRAIHIDRWVKKGAISKYTDQARIGFIEEICEVAARRGELFMPLLRIDGNIVAYIIGFHVGDRIFDWNTSFDPYYKNNSPGALLLIEVLQRVESININRYEFLTGNEDHKFLWASHYGGNVSVELVL